MTVHTLIYNQNVNHIKRKCELKYRDKAKYNEINLKETVVMVNKILAKLNMNKSEKAN